jgi:hypothetical protein
MIRCGGRYEASSKPAGSKGSDISPAKAQHRDSKEGEMTYKELRDWMKLVNTRTLELIILSGNGPEWYTRAMTEEIQRRRASI